MRRVQILSPFRGNSAAERARNVAYAQAAMLDCLERNEAPFAPHLLYPAVLDESDPEQRRQGINAGLAWMSVADVVVVYHDLGYSDGMNAELRAAMDANVRAEFRSIEGWAAGQPAAASSAPEATKLRALPRVVVAEITESWSAGETTVLAASHGAGKCVLFGGGDTEQGLTTTTTEGTK